MDLAARTEALATERSLGPGVAQSTISEIEAGRRTPALLRLRTVQLLAAALEVDAGALVHLLLCEPAEVSAA